MVDCSGVLSRREQEILKGFRVEVGVNENKKNFDTECDGG